ncbi:hypothetical protein ACQ4PT_024174 [Festuca glaucescens]
MASSSGRRAALTLLVALVLVAGSGLACAARPAPAEQSSEGEVYGSAYLAPAVDKARETVEMLMARLPAGSSRKGPGH